MITIISGIFGGLLRFAPEILKFFNAKSDRKHELDMQDKAFNFEKLRSEAQLAVVQEQGRAEWATGSLEALTTSIEAQGKPSGVKWVDGINSLIRPLITLQWVVLIYPAVVIASFIIAIQSGVPALDAMGKAFGPEEKALVAFIIDFWFIGRVLERGRLGK
jgi:hypothetical protein